MTLSLKALHIKIYKQTFCYVSFFNQNPSAHKYYAHPFFLENMLLYRICLILNFPCVVFGYFSRFPQLTLPTFLSLTPLTRYSFDFANMNIHELHGLTLTKNSINFALPSARVAFFSFFC